MDPASEHQLVAALDGMPMGLLLIDSGGAVRYANALAVLWDQDPPRELLGQRLPDGFPGWLGAQSAETFRRAVADQAAACITEHSPRSDLPLETRVSPVAEGVIVWVSEAHAPADAGREAASAQDALLLREQRVRHDLMQPLGAISNYAELIRQQSTGATQRHAGEIDRIVRALAARLRQSAEATVDPRAGEPSGPPLVRDDEQDSGQERDAARDR